MSTTSEKEAGRIARICFFYLPAFCMLTLGAVDYYFYDEPEMTRSLLLFGSFWLALPLVLRRFIKVDPARKQELIDKLRAAQRKQEEEEEAEAREDLPRGAASPYREDPGASEARITASRKRKMRMLIALLCLPGICLVAGGVVNFYLSWATIQDPVMVTETVESAKKCLLFGAFWLAFPIAFALIPDVDPARKQELIDKLRAAQRKQEEEEEEEEAEAREDVPRGAASPYRAAPGASEARITASQKKTARIARIGFFYAPALALITLGALIYVWVWSSIENPMTVTGTVERIYTSTQRDSDGESNVDLVVVSFTTAKGQTATHTARVGPTLFFSVGDPARVRYNAEDPTQAMITGFFGEPGGTGTLILLGGFWLALPMVLRRFMKVDPARKQELIDRLRAAQKRNEEE